MKVKGVGLALLLCLLLSLAPAPTYAAPIPPNVGGRVVQWAFQTLERQTLDISGTSGHWLKSWRVLIPAGWFSMGVPYRVGNYWYVTIARWRALPVLPLVPFAAPCTHLPGTYRPVGCPNPNLD